MLQNGVLDLADVLRPHPVLGGAPQEALTGVLVLLGALVVPQRAVHGRQPDDDVGVISADPGLVVHPIDVELLAGVGRGVLVVLLEDLVEAHEVEVDVLLEGEEGLGDGVGSVADAVENFFVGRVLVVLEGGHLSLEGGDLVAQLRDLFEGELLDLEELRVDAGVEVLFGRGRVGGGELPPGRVGGRGGGEGHFAGGVVDAADGGKE